MRISVRMWSHLLLMAGMLIASLYLYRTVPLSANTLTHIYILDVGQGDSIVIRTAAQETILVDGGPTDEVVTQLRSILPPWDPEIDLMIASHAHADHVTGLLAVLENYQVKEFWYSGAQYDTQIYNDLLSRVAGSSIPTSLVAYGSAKQFTDSSLRVISPPAVRPSDSDPNETSVVTLFTAGNFDILLTGDMTIKNEASLLASNRLQNVDVLKVGHQGSHTSSSEQFIDAIQPELGVISVGADNDYGHPHADVLERFSRRQIPVLRTDELGTVHLLTDGFTYKVATSYGYR